MSVIANSTTTNAVFRSDGIQLYGLDAEIELKVYYILREVNRFCLNTTIFRRI